MSDEDVTEITDPTGKLVAVTVGNYEPRRDTGTYEDGTPITRETIAAKRGVQTWWQGLGVAVLVAVATLLLAQNLPTDGNWLPFLQGIIQAAVTAAAAWAIRRYGDASGFDNQ